MKRTSLIILIIVMVVILIIFCGCTSTEINNEINSNIPEEQNYIEQQEMIENQSIECEHDWVVTSKYNFFLNSYRTISKCSICGKEID